MNDYPLEVQRAEETRYQFISVKELERRTGVPHISKDPDFRDAQRSARALGIWMLTAGAVLFAGLLWLYVRYR